MMRWLVIVAAACSLVACKGWDSDTNLSALSADELRALFTHGYESIGGAAKEQSCAIEGGGESTQVTIVVGTLDTEVDACINAPQADCKASLLEACWASMSGDLCKRLTTSECNAFTDCVNGF